MSIATTGNNGGSLLRTYSKHEDEAQDKKLIRKLIREHEAEEEIREAKSKGQKKAIRRGK